MALQRSDILGDTWGSLRHYGRLCRYSHDMKVLLGLHVREARAAGWTWTEIAAAADITVGTAKRYAVGIVPGRMEL